MKLIWLGYLVYNLDNCIIICIETNFRSSFYDICSLFNNYLAILVKHLGGSTFNIYKNYDNFHTENALIRILPIQTNLLTLTRK